MKQKVTIQLRDLYIPFKFRLETANPSPSQEKELVQLLMEQLKESLVTEKDLKKNVSVKKATIHQEGFMFEDEIYPGRVVRTIHNEIGIVTGYRKEQVDAEKPYSVVLPGHRLWYFSANELFETAATFNEARCIRLDFCRKEKLWHEGDSAYLTLPNAERIQVVVGKTSRGYTKLYEVGNTSNSTASWNVLPYKLKDYLTEFISEEEHQLYVSPDELIANYRRITDKTKLPRAEALTIFQKSIIELQPTLIERANESVKELFNQNYKNYLKVMSTLELEGVTYDSIMAESNANCS